MKRERERYPLSTGRWQDRPSYVLPLLLPNCNWSCCLYVEQSTARFIISNHFPSVDKQRKVVGIYDTAVLRCYFLQCISCSCCCPGRSGCHMHWSIRRLWRLHRGTTRPLKRVRTVDCDNILTIYLSLCTQSADQNAFWGTGCIMYNV